MGVCFYRLFRASTEIEETTYVSDLRGDMLVRLIDRRFLFMRVCRGEQYFSSLFSWFATVRYDAMDPFFWLRRKGPPRDAPGIRGRQTSSLMKFNAATAIALGVAVSDPASP